VIVVGDLGGTSCRLAVYANGKLSRVTVFKSDDFKMFEDVVERYVAENKLRVSAACFGVPGPVVDGVAKLTNLPWIVSERALRRTLNAKRVRLINDFEAVGYGIDTLKRKDVMVLQKGTRVKGGARVVLGAGTGLGAVIIVGAGKSIRVLPSEGGMARLSVQDEVSSRLRTYLERVTGFADAESALSGAGIVRIYDFLRDERVGTESATRREDLRHGDRAAVITDHALRGRDPLCVGTLDLFVSLYGAEAAVLALTALATGGVYVAGGIAPRIIKKLRDGTFVNAFLAYKRMRHVLGKIPIFVVMDELVGLKGAVVVAQGL